MKLPIKWLRDYVDIDITPEELAEKLFSSGFEVEEIIDLGRDVDRVVSAKILSADPHPDADKLRVCRVDAGPHGLLQIVTGAKNVGPGDVVALALDGACLPGGVRIKTGKLRGVESQGMMCGGSELNVTDAEYAGASVDGVLILHEEDKEELGVPLKKILGLDEIVLDISLTANRPDCQSVYGMAREVAAILKRPLKSPALDYRTCREKTSDRVKVRIESPALCRRYMASYVGEVEIKPSPAWIQERLRLCGLRPINNIVDITNFVLLELGNPMHSFDSREIRGGEIVVRNAKAGEKLTTLDGRENQLTEDMLVICDGEGPIAVAGIMGGLHSGIRPDTRAVVFEVAKFARDSIRKTSRKLGLRSDSSARYEKGVDSASCGIATRRALHLIEETGSGKIYADTIDVCLDDLTPRRLEVSFSRINAVLGIEVPRAEVLDILNRLDFRAEADGDALRLVVPLYREDIDRDPDIAEEVIRMYGFDHIKPTLMPAAEKTNGGMNERQRNLCKLKRVLTASGLSECVTYSFINPKLYESANVGELAEGSVRLVNPLSEDTSVMRRALFPSMLSVVKFNLSRKVEEGRFFEVARVYQPKEGTGALPTETETLCMACFGLTDFFVLKGYVENVLDAFGLKYEFRRSKAAWLHPGISADVFARGQLVGSFGEVHPDVLEKFEIRQKVFVAQLDADKILDFEDRRFVYREIPLFQAINRDLAFVVKEDIPSADILREIKKAAGPLLESARVFDSYRGANIGQGQVSLAFSLAFRAKDRTLKYDDVNPEIARVTEAISKKFNARLRE